MDRDIADIFDLRLTSLLCALYYRTANSLMSYMLCKIYPLVILKIQVKIC